MKIEQEDFKREQEIKSQIEKEQSIIELKKKKQSENGNKMATGMQFSPTVDNKSKAIKKKIDLQVDDQNDKSKETDKNVPEKKILTEKPINDTYNKQLILNDDY